MPSIPSSTSTRPPPTATYTLPLHGALPIYSVLYYPLAALLGIKLLAVATIATAALAIVRSEEHTSELQSRPHLVCRLLREKKNETGRAHLRTTLTHA